MRLSPMLFAIAMTLLPSLCWGQRVFTNRTSTVHPSTRPPQILPPPILVVRKARRSVPLKITSFNVDTQIVGHLARTKVTMTFHNPNDRIHEGDLYFPLPEGSTVSGYALDIKGVMVDGVVVDKDQGRQVFEKEIRKGVDPGLVEWTRGNTFKTRIYPIPAKGTRTVSVTYVSSVDFSGSQATYTYPLAFKKKIPAISFRVEVVRAPAPPVISIGSQRQSTFRSWRSNYVAELKMRNTALTKDLVITLPRMETQPVRVELAKDGYAYFTILDRPTIPTLPTKRTPRHLALYWDASLSRQRANTTKELRLLERYLDELGARLTVSLVVFRNEAQKRQVFSLPHQRGALLKRLRSTVYDGGTQLGALPKVPHADLVLLFSDGLSTFGKEDPKKFGAPIYAINSSTSSNHAFLKYLALRSGGAYLNLKRLSVEQAAEGIGGNTFAFLGATVQGEVECMLYPKVQVPVTGPFSLVGKLKGKRARVTLNYGVNGKVLQSRSYLISRRGATKGNLLRREWAQKRLDHLLLFPEQNREAIAKLGKRYSLVTPMTSLLVWNSSPNTWSTGYAPPPLFPILWHSTTRVWRKNSGRKRER